MNDATLYHVTILQHYVKKKAFVNIAVKTIAEWGSNREEIKLCNHYLKLMTKYWTI